MNEPLIRDILRVLCRIPIPRGQLVLYRLAMESPEKGFTNSRVREAMNLDQATQSGLMGAFTTRINNTPREVLSDTRPGVSMVFKQSWDGQEKIYRPLPELLEAIRRLPVLAAHLQKPIAEVVDGSQLRVPAPAGLAMELPTGEGRPAEPTAPPPTTFSALLDSLDAAGLVYTPDFVANLLLALQVKRFVILTGISGTGKTRIAQVVAERFNPPRQVEVPADPGERAALITVMPYMRRYNRMILPRALVSQVPVLATTQGTGSIQARWPGGTINLTIWVRDAVSVLFRGELREWFHSTFAEGDRFLLRLDGPADGPPSGLVLDKPPKPTMREDRVPNSEILAVRPDWTDHRGLLGAYNPLTRQYLATPFLRLLLRATREAELAQGDRRPALPFFLVLDEMNLARVEHYFADFLSAIESGEPLHLHDSPEVEDGTEDTDTEAFPVPQQIRVPPNLFFIGTVNVDESTYLFSPKVLDRAFTLELNSVDLGGLEKGPVRGGDLDLAAWSGRLDPPEKSTREDWKWLRAQEDGALCAELQAFHRLLARHNRHFGYRVALEVARFVRLAADQAADPGSAAWAALDLALLQKVLVKLHGTRQELAVVLDAMLSFALMGARRDKTPGNLDAWSYQPESGTVVPKDEAADMAAVFPRSAAKLWRMRERLSETGFTSWIE